METKIYLSNEEIVWIKPNEVKNVLACSESTLVNLVACGKLEPIVINGFTYFNKEETSKLLKSKTLKSF